MAQENKYSIDILLKFAFAFGLSLIVLHTILIYPRAILTEYPFLRKPIQFICTKIPEICRAPHLIKLTYYAIFTLIPFGIEIKRMPSTSKKKILIFIGLIFILISDYWLHVSFSFVSNLIHSTIAIIFYVLVLVALRRHFFYFSKKDQFNEKNEEFKQTKTLMTNPYSVNIKMKNGWINVVNPFRGCIVMGTPGSGKTFSIIEEFIRQQMKKNFSFMVYDFKFPSLTEQAYSFYKHSKSDQKFKIINLDQVEYSEFINPIDPDLITKTSDAIEAAQTVLFNLNKEWIEKMDFFAQSAISYFAACIYFLKLYKNGKFCTLPHAISLASVQDEKVFKVLTNEKELDFFLAPFKDALEKKAYEQLAGQTASARIPLSQIATKQLFWVMGNNVYPHLNVNLNINLKEEKTILVLANDPKSQKTNSPALGLIVTQLMKIINVQNRDPCTLVIDELPTMYFMGLDNLMATARSNKVCALLGFQDLEQLKRDYGDKVAQTIFNISGNIFSGAVKSNTAKELQEIFGKTKQKLKNVSMDTNVTSVSINEQFEYVLPQSRISQLSQGEFCGILADNFGEELNRKVFRGKILINKERKNIKKKQLEKNKNLPEDIESYLDLNFKRIIEEINIIVDNELGALKEKEQAEGAKTIKANSSTA